MDSSHTWELAQTLFDSIGPRLTGTPQGTQASDWVIKKYKSWGIDAKREQYGTWRGWRRGYSHIDLDQAARPLARGDDARLQPGHRRQGRHRRDDHSPDGRGQQRIREVAAAARRASSCSFRRRIRRAGPRRSGRRMATPASKARMDTTIVEARQRLDARAFATPATRSPRAIRPATLGMRLEKAGAAGVIVSNLASRDGRRWGTYTVFDTNNTTALGIAMSCEDYGLRLSSHRAQAGAAAARQRRVASSLGECRCSTRSRTIKGTREAERVRDALGALRFVGRLAGATDNGTGTITMMEAMRILKQAYPKPKRTIVVGHWSGEEQGLNGSRAFAEDHPEIVTGLQALFNQDNGTGRIVQHRRASGFPTAARTCSSGSRKLPHEFQQQIQLQRRRRAGDAAAPTTRRSTATARRRSGSARSAGTTARTRGTRTATRTTRSCSTI